MTEQLHLKYRPKNFDEVVGQDAAVRGLKATLRDEANRSFIFQGPSGVGKTTLARIVASEVGAEGNGILEIDAATHTGVDAMRDVSRSLLTYGLGGSGVKVAIVDEAHRLSRQAWDSLLKDVEEPPDHVYWCFCTTEPSRIPKTIRTRCTSFELDPLTRDDTLDLLDDICQREGWDPPDSVLGACAGHAAGSARRAVVALALVRDCEDRESALEALGEVDSEDSDYIELARMLVQRKATWPKCRKILQAHENTNPEGIRRVIVAYVVQVILGKKAEDVRGLLAVLEAFDRPYSSDAMGISHLILALGSLIYEEE